MQIQCASCGKQMNLPASAVGKSVRCTCGQTLRVPKAAAGAPPAKVAGTPSMQADLESYWWLMTYIRINRILGYIFLALLLVGAFLLVFANIGMIQLLFKQPANEFFLGIFTMFVSFAGYLIVGFVYLVIWFASADFLRAVVEIAENTRRIK
ncbi:zinc-ribbon domain-containing protein [bacterium]|nr:zinc-ribbon domain-containing protein [bacterium]